MNHKHYRNLILLGISMLAAGCVTRSPVTDLHLGESVSLLKSHQILNPKAGLNQDPVAGIDGKAAKSAYDEYQKSFRVPVQQPNALSIGVGGTR